MKKEIRTRCGSRDSIVTVRKLVIQVLCKEQLVPIMEYMVENYDGTRFQYHCELTDNGYEYFLTIYDFPWASSLLELAKELVKVDVKDKYV